MSQYTKYYNPAKTPQNEPIPGKNQVENNAGGYVFQISKWDRLKRFLILGSDTPTYYQSVRKLTKENAGVVMECWTADPRITAEIIDDVSFNGKAAKQDPAIFALALGVVHEDVKARTAAYAIVNRVCRTASHLFQFVATCRELGKGNGRGMRRALAKWYENKSTEALAYQAIKYRQQNGFTHKRCIELSNKGAGKEQGRRELYMWMRGKHYDDNCIPDLILAHLRAMESENREELIQLVSKYKLPWEAIPTDALNDPGVWKAMLPHMGLTALIRNLGNMTGCGAITQMDCADVSFRLADRADIFNSRMHPFSVLQALAVYKQGYGVRGRKSWTPIRQVIDALDEAFYHAFMNAEQTNKRIMLALDVSDSMRSSIMGSPLSCREASAALALVTMSRESNVMVTGFTSGPTNSFRNPVLTELLISPRQRLDDVIHEISGLPFGATDCALPMRYALDKQIPIDAFVIYTDNETWHGTIHPVQALKEYRRKMGIPAKLIVVGMTSTGFSIADPDDAGMLDVVGMDSSVPKLISDFIK